MRHTNPYRINDGSDIFEVSENSSHPDLKDSLRLWHFGGYTFKTATQLMNFFNSEGLDPKTHWIEPKWERNTDGKSVIHIFVKPRWQLNEQMKRKAKRLDQVA
jgi:hypothetical protein